jgi:HEAT repeat protein
MGPDASAAVPAIMRVLENLDEHEYVRGGAAWALGLIGSKAADAVPLLARTLSSKHVSVRRNAARAIGKIAAAQTGGSIGPTSPISPIGPMLGPNEIADLLKLLSGDEDAAVRVSAAIVLWQIQRHPKVIPALESMLRSRQGSTAPEAAFAVGELGPDAEPAVPALVAALAHPDNDTRRAAAHSLGRIGPAAIPALRNAIGSGEDQAKCHVVEALGWIGPSSVDALIGALASPSPPVRRSAARALGRLGPAAKQAEPALVKAVSDPESELRDAAAAALKRIRGL